MVNRVANKMLPGAYQATLVARMEKLEDDLVRVAAGRRDLKEMLLSLITGQLGPEYAEVFAQRMGIEISS